MDVVHPRCAGIDVSKRDAKVCVRIASEGRAKAKSTVTTWGAVTNQVLALCDHLIAEQVTLVVMEATSDYWKPFFYLLEDGPFEVMLVNARHVKNLPGRKTDVSDAALLAQLGAHGLVRGSFVPPQPVRQLRDLTRTRTIIVRERSREIQRLEKLLEDAGIKLSSVASDLTGVSGRAMLEALVEGVRDPIELADLAKRRMRIKIPQLVEALTGRFNEHHAFLVRLHLNQIDQHNQSIQDLTDRIEVGDRALSWRPGPHRYYPGNLHHCRRRDHRRDRRRHVPVPERRTSGFVGRHLPGVQRVGRPNQIHPHPPGEPLPQGRPRDRRVVSRTQQGHLLRRQVPSDRITTRTHESTRRPGARHADRHLEHGQHRLLLHGSRRRLLFSS